MSGGGLPARVWRDFMTQALGQKSAPKRTTPPANPEGSVQPLDVPDIGAIPDGDRTSVGMQAGQAVIRTEIHRTPLDLNNPPRHRPPPPPAGAPPPPQPRREP